MSKRLKVAYLAAVLGAGAILVAGPSATYAGVANTNHVPATGGITQPVCTGVLCNRVPTTGGIEHCQLFPISVTNSRLGYKYICW
jgi:hypothetical protein